MLTETNMSMIGRVCIIRCRDAGVHIGILQSQQGREVWLQNASRIWRWRGANTLNELAQEGCDRTYTRISKAVPDILLLEACEVLPVNPALDFSPVWPA